MESSGQSDDDLRRLYLDWCSTQVAKRFLELSLDDVWLRSHLAASLPAPDDQHQDPSSSLLAVDRIPGYLDLVRRTSLLLAREMDLPLFPDWKEAYLKNPQEFADDILDG